MWQHVANCGNMCALREYSCNMQGICGASANKQNNVSPDPVWKPVIFGSPTPSGSRLEARPRLEGVCADPVWKPVPPVWKRGSGALANHLPQGVQVQEPAVLKAPPGLSSIAVRRYGMIAIM